MKRSLKISFAIAVTITILTMGQPAYARKPQVGRATAAQAQRVACCVVTAIGSPAGVITAKENTTGRTFEFQAPSTKVMPQIHVGMPVYANFSTMQVSLNGTADCCKIISISPPPAAVAPAPAAKPAPGAPAAAAPATTPKSAPPPSAGGPVAKPAPGAPAAVGQIQNKLGAAQSCIISAINTYTRVVTAKEIATGYVITFQIAHLTPLDGAKLFQTFPVGGKVDLTPLDGAALRSGSNVRVTVQGLTPLDGIVTSISTAAAPAAVGQIQNLNQIAKTGQGKPGEQFGGGTVQIDPCTIASADVLKALFQSGIQRYFPFEVNNEGKHISLSGPSIEQVTCPHMAIKVRTAFGYRETRGLVQFQTGGSMELQSPLVVEVTLGGPERPIVPIPFNVFRAGAILTNPQITSLQVTNIPSWIDVTWVADCLNGKYSNWGCTDVLHAITFDVTGLVRLYLQQGGTLPGVTPATASAPVAKPAPGAPQRVLTPTVATPAAQPAGSAQTPAATSSAAPMAAGAIQNKLAPAAPNCTISAIDINTGVVTATENATGKSFQFKVADAALLNSLKVGQGVYANFAANVVSLDGISPGGTILSVAAAPATTSGMGVGATPVSPGTLRDEKTTKPAPEALSSASTAAAAPAPTTNASGAPSGSTAGSQQPAGKSGPGASQGNPQRTYTVTPGVFMQQRPQFKILASGKGWNLHSITGTLAGRAFTDDQSFLIIGREGVLNAPIPAKLRDALLKGEQNSEGNDKVYFVHKRSAELAALGKVAELRQLSQVPMLVNPSGSTSSSTPPPPTNSVSLPGCDNQYDPWDWSNTASASASTSFATPGDLLMLSLNDANLGPVNATGEVDIKFPMNGQLEATVRLDILEVFCQPIALRLKDVRIKANMEVDSSLHLDAQIGADYDLHKRFHWDLYRFGFTIGGIPQYVALAAFVQPGTQFTAPNLIQVKYDATGKGQGGIDYTCTMDNCTGQRTFSHTWTNSGGISFLAQGLRAVVKPYVRAGFEVYLDDDVHGIVVYAGFEPYVQGDLWAYTGNCTGTGVEARGARSPEYKALTADLDVGLESHMGFAAPMISSLLAKDFTHDVWTQHIQFYDLIGSTALAPEVTADMPAYVGSPKNVQVKMRPCWPYRDKMAYHVVWGDSTMDAFGWGTANGGAMTQSHSWATAGQYNLVATLYGDEHGRVFPDRGTTLPVEVQRVLVIKGPVDEVKTGAPAAATAPAPNPAPAPQRVLTPAVATPAGKPAPVPAAPPPPPPAGSSVNSSASPSNATLPTGTMAQPSGAEKTAIVHPPVEHFPCCVVTAIDSHTSIGAAKDNANGRTFEFQVTKPALLPRIQPGTRIYVNFNLKVGEISLDDITPCGIILGTKSTPTSPGTGASAATGQPLDAQKPGLVSPPLQPLPCCKVTAIDSRTSVGTAKTDAIGRTTELQVTNPGLLADPRTGLVLAHVNATGQPFVFFVKDPATRQSLKVGQGVYANFPGQQVSLDGGTECCSILALGKPNPGTGGTAPAGAPPPLPTKIATLAEAAKSSTGFILSARAPIGSAGNPAVIVSADWARSVSIPVGSTTPGGRYTIISAAQYQTSANGPVSPVETLLQQGRSGSIDGYYLVDATTSGVHPRPPRAKPGGSGGGSGSGGTGGTAGSNDPLTFLANAHPGDILFASHPGVNYDTFGEFNHEAMVITANWGGGNVPSGEALVAEETAYNLGTDQPGARLVFWSDFSDPSRNYNKIALGRVGELNEQQTNNVVAWAISRLGRPYRWPTDFAPKDDDNRMYCSQYVWIDYLRNMNIDLDSDGGYIVFPDDIYYDQYVQHIGEVDLPNSGLPF